MTTVLPAAAPETVDTELLVEGMTCGACSARIERALRKLDGVQANVNYATGRAAVTHAGTVTVEDLVTAVERAGYRARQPEPGTRDDEAEAAHARELAALGQQLAACAALALPVIVLSMVPAIQFPFWQWTALGLTAPVALWGALPFHRAALANLRHATASMDTLVSVGTLAAFGWSIYAMVFGTAGRPGLTHSFDLTLAPTDGAGHIYLEVAAGVTTFVLAGRYLEARARRRSGAALRGLLALTATDARVLRDGREHLVPVDRLAVGDTFLVRPGEKVATDGVVIDGSCALDTAAITGEPTPADVAPGDDVIGGCVALGGRLVVQATRVGADTQLAQTAALVERAQTGKAAVQRLADRVCGEFVPVVLMLAAATWGFWTGAGADAATSFAAATAVLIVACPCALGLATPTALLVGTGRAAQLGVLVTGPAVLESTRRVDTIVLDKTGTVTTGVMTVTDVVPADGEDRDEVLVVAGALAGTSAHPVAQAVARHAADRAAAPAPEVRDVVSLDGLGMQGVIGDVEVLLGRPRLLQERGIPIPGPLQEPLADAAANGRTTVAMAWAGRARAVLVLSDTIRPTSTDAIAELRRLGLDPVLLTGDGMGAARAVADTVGITTVVADALPTDKVELIARLQAQGRVVAMVGDGINDAAALAQADLGIAMGTGTDIAISAADITLVRADLTAAVDAVRLSRRTLAVIKANLAWAFGYNILALPVAAAGMLHPMLAGAFMAASSVLVVTNSLRLAGRGRRTSTASTATAAARS
ncbi:MAG TPA: heavy metal translocating P-type ATPase [Pseudonocardia sp.]|nr:heavy metal translocating P-type ATPase [Pseudonocardia sp.]